MSRSDFHALDGSVLEKSRVFRVNIGRYKPIVSFSGADLEYTENIGIMWSKAGYPVPLLTWRHLDSEWRQRWPLFLQRVAEIQKLVYVKFERHLLKR
ncbi:hypothetical protein Tco_0927502 [Tanacetum coccineum]